MSSDDMMKNRYDAEVSRLLADGWERVEDKWLHRECMAGVFSFPVAATINGFANSRKAISATPKTYLEKKGRDPRWRQDTPVMQAVSLIQSIEMDAHNIEKEYCVSPKVAAERIQEQAQQLRLLLAYVVGDSWE